MEELITREFLDLLDVGGAGVYELRWIANSIGGTVISPGDPILRAALLLVLARSRGRLAWVRWPDDAFQRDEPRAVAELPDEVFADPEPVFLAVLPMAGQ